MNCGVVHIIGGGLAGLSAATELCRHGRQVHLHEATGQLGGRCRSYFDSTLGMEIDNGNHLVLSGNTATLRYLDLIGSRDNVTEYDAVFPFVDLSSGARWTLRPNRGSIPWWILDRRRNVPGARLKEYMAVVSLLGARPARTIGETISCKGALYNRLVEPVLLAALNTGLQESSAALAASVIRLSLMGGAQRCRPLIAHAGLSAAFIDPAVSFIRSRGGVVDCAQRLHALERNGDRVTGLQFVDAKIDVSDDDGVILATPPPVARDLMPDLQTPTQYRAIVNAHYRVRPPPGTPPFTGIVNGLAQWLFAFPERLSVTISAADAHLATPRERLATLVWNDVANITGIQAPLPVWQIVRERRATFAATPQQDACRPRARTALQNLSLAGDWTQTGLPATIEGAIVSGVSAARLQMQGSGVGR